LIEAVPAFLALFSAGIFVAHAVDAYTQVAKVNEAVCDRENRQCSQNLRHLDRMPIDRAVRDAGQHVRRVVMSARAMVDISLPPRDVRRSSEAS